ncbi:serine/threonine protein phosphatase 1 [Meinhardsimonia xiamenensis]|jgi:serine/threonine protein phosphatase 1|uniref:Serine/threonine protein phosphatase 1 n=1 Tax=Meinhardsimonia xiamenensis TaxID=990712 RepID=A0A1G8XTF9_9RHOB|nr:metallophosphoesterase [Meinhardsimonia xiamenensis]PRX37037.1 serine/threonine protein phosphatase 1 [Meinhardsimonia xiamenensis]SDJ93831.1 serine/threonine protein phosphatase 1 [Meinhardsimonia xiamenensis]
MRVYAIGDVHGQLEMLRAAHARIAADRARVGDFDAPVVQLGDLCDRGPDTAGVIDFILERRVAGELWVTLRGNHDRMFLDFIEEPGAVGPAQRPGLVWLDHRLGGIETLRSYGIEADGRLDVEELQALAPARVPAAHKRLLREQRLYMATDDLILVHAGIRPGVPLEEQSEEDLIWIREPFLSDRRDHGRLVVHGHTPVEAPMHAGNRVNLDTGAGYFRRLTAAVFEGRRCWILEDEGRVLLPPPPGWH